MTTVKITKSGYSDLTIYAAKVEEISNKDIISYPYPFPQPDWPSPPTALIPRRESIDLLNITREFTITGLIDADSTPLGDVLSARDTLMNMQRSGGAVSLKYGVSTDVTGSGYTPSANNMYYHANGFTCQIRRIMVSEINKGGAEDGVYTSNAIIGAPELFEVTIVLLSATEVST